jgi:hypothetical protein
LAGCTTGSTTTLVPKLADGFNAAKVKTVKTAFQYTQHLVLSYVGDIKSFTSFLAVVSQQKSLFHGKNRLSLNSSSACFFGSQAIRQKACSSTDLWLCAPRLPEVYPFGNSKLRYTI